ncbi:unnamed protein product [Acanthoscelides obtectus]|uniref:Uncharacterized protein n=1 Tax=Acanthoscelides obtectus TaxID=200917 RepID=A0A9P0PC26_ACAOB|nr:unnamed protein product [Acanthoscelides obtectus]CAK1620950.1 hypothetical protein AOBTE_LOCUS666 [Acanthoscelides obtectus]
MIKSIAVLSSVLCLVLADFCKEEKGIESFDPEKWEEEIFRGRRTTEERRRQLFPNHSKGSKCSGVCCASRH